MRASLYSYLLQHLQLPLQGLGTIYVERIPARTDFANKQILPPGIKFRFDPYFDAPDHELLLYIASKEQLSDADALKWFNEWCFELRQEIKTASFVTLDKVGSLSQDISGEIIFESVDPNFAFAIPVHAERVVHQDQHHMVQVGELQWSSDEAKEHLKELEFARKDAWWIYAAILAGLSGILWFYYYHSQVATIPTWGTRFGL